MIKTGNIEDEKTPSVITGRPANFVKDGEPVCKGEVDKSASLELPEVPVSEPANSRK